MPFFFFNTILKIVFNCNEFFLSEEEKKMKRDNFVVVADEDKERKSDSSSSIPGYYKMLSTMSRKFRLLFYNSSSPDIIGEIIENDDAIEETFDYFRAKRLFNTLAATNASVPSKKRNTDNNNNDCRNILFTSTKKAVYVEQSLKENNNDYSSNKTEIITIPVTTEIKATAEAIIWLNAAIKAKTYKGCPSLKKDVNIMHHPLPCGCVIKAALRHKKPVPVIKNSSSSSSSSSSAAAAAAITSTTTTNIQTSATENSSSLSKEKVLQQSSIAATAPLKPGSYRGFGDMVIISDDMPSWLPVQDETRSEVCKFLCFSSCHTMTASGVPYTYSEALDPLIALGIAMTLNADKETLSLLASAFILHFVIFSDSLCADAVDKLLSDDQYLNAVLNDLIQPVCSNESSEHGEEKDAEKKSTTTTIANSNSIGLISNLYVDCLRCILLKDCLATARLARFDVRIDRYVALWPICDAKGLPDSCYSKNDFENPFAKSVQVMEFMLKGTVNRFNELLQPKLIDQLREMPPISQDAIVGLCVLSTIDKQFKYYDGCVDVVLDSPLEEGSVFMESNIDNDNDIDVRTVKNHDYVCCKKYKKASCSNCKSYIIKNSRQMDDNPIVSYNWPTLRCKRNCFSGSVAGIYEIVSRKALIGGDKYCGHGIDCLTQPYLSVMRFAYFPKENKLFATTQALASTFLTRKIMCFNDRNSITTCGIDLSHYNYDLYDFKDGVHYGRGSKMFNVLAVSYLDSEYTTEYIDTFNKFNLINAIRYVVEIEIKSQKFAMNIDKD